MVEPVDMPLNASANPSAGSGPLAGSGPSAGAGPSLRASPPIPYAFARREGVLIVPGTRCLTVREGASPAAIIEASRIASQPDSPLSAQPLEPAAFDRLLSDTYSSDGLTAVADAAALSGIAGAASLAALVPESSDLLDTDDSAPVIRLINAILAQAVQFGASDIHLEPADEGMAVRIRRDGIMEEVLRLPPAVAPMLVSRVKVMSRLDIAERRVPQDGRMSVSLGQRGLDVRVSTLPARNGERVVMRILDQAAVALELSDLGLDAATESALRDALAAPNGIMLVTGPTGAGKTTTLYAALKTLNTGRRTILTVEDPVEYAVEGVGQTQVDTRVGLTFAQGLRAILRQDPDVVMVGEIRDRETAEIAVQAALTGHLVLSTVHANSAAGAVTRLRDFGVETFLIAATLRAVVAQRLVRTVCPDCVTQEPLPAVLAARVGLPEGTPVARANGCDRCRHSGYRGRKGLFELIALDAEERALVNDGASEDALERAGRSQSLADSARALLLARRTTPTEVLPLFPPVSARTAKAVVT